MQKFESSSVNSSIMFYILIKSSINSELSLALNVPSVIYMMKHHGIYIMNAFVHKIYGTNLDYILQKKMKNDLPVLTPQSAIFGFVNVQDQNYLLFNHLPLIFKYNIHNSRVDKNLNFQSLKCVISGIKFIEEPISNDYFKKMVEIN